MQLDDYTIEDFLWAREDNQNITAYKYNSDKHGTFLNNEGDLFTYDHVFNWEK